MQVSGKRSDLSRGSESYRGPECKPCRTSGQRVSANGYCQTCREHLCRQCYKDHKKHLPCRNHVLLDKSNMPMTTRSAGTKHRTCSVSCNDHPEEIAKFFCVKHNNVACSVCSHLYHKSCEVVYLPEYKGVAKYKDSAEYKELVTELNKLDKEAKACVNDIRTIRTSLPKNTDNLVKSIQHSAKEIIDNIKEQENELIKQAQTKSEADQMLYEKSEKECVALTAELEQRNNQFETLQNEEIDEFVSSKQILHQIPTYRQSLSEYKAMNRAPEYRFGRDEELNRFLASKRTLGKIEPLDIRYAKIVKLPDINAASSDVSGMAFLPPHTILAVDDESLQAINTTTGTITSQVSIPGSPWDVTILPDNCAAVTIPTEKRLQLLTTNGNLTLTNSIDVDGKCYGIAATSENIIVYYNSPGKVEIMDFYGERIKSIFYDGIIEEMNLFFRYITTIKETSGWVIYILDRSTDALTKLSMKGDILETYRHINNWHVAGLTRVCGGLVVCIPEDNTVEVVNGDRDVTTLLNKSDHGVDRPVAVCYCPSQRRLYFGGSVISVYQLS